MNLTFLHIIYLKSVTLYLCKSQRNWRTHFLLLCSILTWLQRRLKMFSWKSYAYFALAILSKITTLAAALTSLFLLCLFVFLKHIVCYFVWFLFWMCRLSFPPELQMLSLLRFLTDHTQTPNLRVKTAALNYITKLAAITDPSQAFPHMTPGSSRDPVQAALHKMIGLYNYCYVSKLNLVTTEEQKS